MKKKSTEEEIKQAMADLKAIQEERAKLQELLSRAQADKEAASAALQAAERDNKAPKANYSDKKYWDSRYSDKVAKTYEWYLDSDTIYEKLKQDAMINHISPTSTILVPGCGNSTLCEDLYRQGHRNIAGMDYSNVVVEAMKKRASDLKLTSLRYFQADARNMPDEGSSSYSIIVDKGTLDAIAAGGDNPKGKSEVEMENAAQYVVEMWRVLTVGGLFVIITTMPADVFEPIAVAPLISGNSYSDVVNWNCGHIAHKLTTPEGGDVYYYCLKKLGNVVKSKKKASNASGSAAASGLKSTDAQKADVMDGIKALLEEARLAKEQVDKAMQKQSAAAADFKGVTAKKNELSNKLNKDLMDAERDEEVRGATNTGGSGLADQLMAGMKDRGEDAETAEKIRKVKEEARKSMPEVRVRIEESSELVSQGFVDVRYVLCGTDLSCWDEDDSLCIVCSRPAYKSENDALLYKTGESQHYETFEYTVQPVKVASFDTTTLEAFQTLPSAGAYFCGHVRVSLPSYGGWYHVSYVRTISHTFECTDPSTGAVTSEYKRIPIKLTQSDSFSVKSSLYNAPPEGFTSKHVVRPTTLKSLRRRGAADMSKNRGRFDLCIEDMQLIQTATVSFVLKCEGEESCSISRVMTWVYTGIDAAMTECVVEADIISTSSELGTSTVRTVYGLCQLTDPQLLASRLDLANGWSEVDELGRIVCRIPYLENASSLSPHSGQASSVSSAVEENSFVAGGVDIQCGFCMNSVVKQGAVTNVKPMATGKFDSMMHDFICCEEMPNQALTTGDVITPQCTLHVATTFLSVNVKDCVTSSYSVECKAYNSLLDVLTAHGGAYCTAPVFAKGGNREALSAEDQASKLARALKGFISTDSCAVVCSRCCSYLGEALLSRDECDPAVCEHPSGGRTQTTTTTPSNDLTITPDDVSDLRFARHCVSLTNLNIGNLLGNQLSIEAMVARSLLHFHSVYNVSNFCLHISNRPPEELLRLQNLKSVYDEVIIVRLLNKDYKCSISGPHSSLSVLRDCIKVSYRCVDMMQLAGTETRIPLTHDEFKQMKTIIVPRSCLFGKTPFKDHSLTVLFK